MVHFKKNARVTGVLFLLGTAPGIAAAVLLGPLLAPSADLSVIATHRMEVLTAALLVMFMGFACTGIGLSLFPVLKGHSETLALSVVGFRLMEGALQVVSAIGLVALLAVSQEFVNAGSPSDSWSASAGRALKAVRDWMSNGTAVLPWCIAAFLYYAVFFKTNLVPRWLSVWGLLGLVLFLASAFSVQFGLLASLSPLQGWLAAPIAVQEMVLAVWLIVKGYQE